MLHRCHLLASFHAVFGYSPLFLYSCFNPMEPHVRKMIEASGRNTPIYWTSINTALFVGQLIASLSAHHLADRFGRRDVTMVIKNVMALAACLIAYTGALLAIPELLVLARLLIGIVTIHAYMSSLYMAECSPTECRGTVSAIPQLGERVWLFLGIIGCTPQAGVTGDNWHNQFLIPVLPILVHLSGIFWMHRSPKFLYIERQQRKATINSIRFYHGEKSNVTAALHRYELEKCLTEDTGGITFTELLGTRHLRVALFLCILVFISRPLGGPDLANHYSTGILSAAGVPAELSGLYSAICMQLPALFVSMISTSMVDLVGRRKLLFTGFSISIAGLTTLFVSTSLHPEDRISGLSICALLMCLCGTAVGPSLVESFIAGELCPQSARMAVYGGAFVVDNLLSIVILQLYPILHPLIGCYCLLPIIGFALIDFGLLAKYLPETKGRTVTEINELWMDLREIEQIENEAHQHELEDAKLMPNEIET